MNLKTKKLVLAAMFAALACVTTMVIKIPSPISGQGYINLGDCIVLLAGWMLSPLYGFLAAAIGSALADLFLGYAVYAPITFVVKGVMALIAWHGVKLMRGKLGNLPSRLVSGLLAEVAMVLGYFVFEGFMYGFATSAVNIPFNGVQGAAGLILGVILIKAFEKNKIAQL